MPTTPTAQLPITALLTAILNAAAATFRDRTEPELVPGAGLINFTDYDTATAAAIKVVALKGSRARVIGALVDQLYAGMTTEGARQQARAEMETFLAWIESHHRP